MRTFRPKQQMNNQPNTQVSTSAPQSAAPHDVVKMISLGGVGVNTNMYIYEYKDDIVIVDCGMGLPEDDMLGVDLVIPDISYLADKKSKIRGIIITHGHDDHIGGLPFIWPELDVPIYTQKLTAGFIKSKFTEHNLPKDKINTLSINDTLNLGAFKISFYQVAHSVPDSTGIVMQTPIGTLIHQSDFKIDFSPVYDQKTDIQKIAQIGGSGVVFMTIDCLRVEREGYNLTERTIEHTFADLEKETEGKILITTMSSSISRIQQAVNVAVKSGRKVALAGRSMENNFQVARDLGYIDVPPGVVVGQDQVKKFPDKNMMVIIAGSMGQVGSALHRVANFDHKYITLTNKDTVVFSGDAIPGTEVDQNNLIDQITLAGAKVYYSTFSDPLHVSGHAAREELKVMISLVKPKFITPIGGNFHHTKAFSDMAVELGYKEEQVLQMRDGDIVEISQNNMRVGGKVELAPVYVDGFGVGDVGEVVLRARQVMSEEGIAVVIVPLGKNHQLMGQPEIISRGFVFERDAKDLLEAGEEIVKSVLHDYSKPGIQTFDWKYLREQIEKNLGKFFYQETNRKPLILPVIINV